MSFDLQGKSHLDQPMSAFARIDNSMDRDELAARMKAILAAKIHGISFSVYLDSQSPNLKSCITEDQIRSRLEMIRPYTQWVRVFSCTCGHEQIPRIAHEMGLKTLVGAWLDQDLETNETEINNLCQIAEAGYVDIAAVGNEVLLRKDLAEDVMIGYIQRVKERVNPIPVGYVDSYYIFREHPQVAGACDIILANCYPFWEFCSLEQSVEYMKQMHRIAQTAGRRKPVIISETGWPSAGSPQGAAVPSPENAVSYFVHTYQWAAAENIKIFYFTSFDEAWKTGPEGDCGSSWGIWDKDGRYKYDF